MAEHTHVRSTRRDTEKNRREHQLYFMKLFPYMREMQRERNESV